MRCVKENSGKQTERGIGSGKAKANEFEPLEHKDESFARGKRSKQPRESKLDLSGVPARSWKQTAWATDDGPTMYSQERQQNDVETSNTRKQDEETTLQLNPQLETNCEGGGEPIRKAET